MRNKYKFTAQRHSFYGGGEYSIPSYWLHLYVIGMAVSGTTLKGLMLEIREQCRAHRMTPG